MKPADTRKLEQTHFIGVLASEALAETLERCRLWMGTRYGCRSGFSTPIHVTLVPPFMMTDADEIACMESALASLARQTPGFTARAQGFGSFSERTLFARVVPDERWDTVRDAVYESVSTACPRRFRKDGRPFVPHLTVANRDIPVDAVAPALAHMDQLALDEDFAVDHIALFRRLQGRWEISNVWELRTNDLARE